jgi:type VI protein secretion system component VasK
MRLSRFVQLAMTTLCLCWLATPAFASDGVVPAIDGFVLVIGLVVLVPVIGIVILLALIARSSWKIRTEKKSKKAELS